MYVLFLLQYNTILVWSSCYSLPIRVNRGNSRSALKHDDSTTKIIVVIIRAYSVLNPIGPIHT